MQQEPINNNPDDNLKYQTPTERLNPKAVKNSLLNMTVTEEVIDNYLIWELCKQKDIQRKIMQGLDGRKLKREIVEKVQEDYRSKAYSLSEKKELVREISSNPKYRLKNFEGCNWKKEKIEIEDLGPTIPRAGDLPPEVITGNIPKVAKFVEDADPEKYHSVRYIRKLAQYPEIINEFRPSVLSPGSTIRQIQKMNRVHGEKDWQIQETYGAIDDGNHRTTARILGEGLEEIECYIGHPKEEY
ncbi:hypothetical protein [Candidatus Nanohalovita haloferacivicina]|uniref:hypothetical protein n=1 Tax=Candidatus Nanohalovita haloferacivicina TaxID=2978046 RepID=UPI00325F9979|nr:hypothetical protein HBNXNv_0791 [Candidatus Nanohalobia archaeon BNXNv]